MKKSNMKIWYIIICAAFLVLCYIGITNVRLADTNNVQAIKQDITIRNDELVEVEFVYDTDMLINYFEIELPTLDDNSNIFYELTDEKGYYLAVENRDIKDLLVDGKGRVVLENQLEGGKGYTLKLGLKESEMQEVNTELYVEILGYKNLSEIYQAFFLVLCVLITLIFLLVVSQNSLYLKVKEVSRTVLFSCKSPTFAEYLIIAVFFLILLMSNMYGDTKAFVHYEVNFWRSIFQEGGLQHFYDYSYKMEQYYKANNIGGAFAAYYDFPMFILFGIWGFPLYLICEKLGIEETSNIGQCFMAKPFSL